MEAQNAIYLDEETGGKGRQFKSRFLVPGLVKYDYGVCLLTKENADKFIQGFVGCPVVINHQEVTDDNAKAVSVGNIFSVWFDEKDGYYWCNGIINDKQAIELINKGYSVSCQYTITEYSDNDSNALHNGNPYDKIIENGKPEHLAIVNNPRYEGAKIAVNAIMAQNEDKWITIHPNGEENKGRHLLLKDGESVEDAMHRNGWYKKRQAKDEKSSDENIKSKVQKSIEQSKKTAKNPSYFDGFDVVVKDGIVKVEKDGKLSKTGFKYDEGATDDAGEDWNVGALSNLIQKWNAENPKQSDTKEEKGEPKKYTYTLTKKEVGNDAWLGGMADTGNYYTNGSFAIDKRYLDIKGQEPKKIPDIDNNVKKLLTETAKKKQKEGNYINVKDFEVGELKSESGKPIPVAKYSYYDEKSGYTRNIYVNKKYNDLFKNFELKFGSEYSPIYAYDKEELVGTLMPILGRDSSYTASNSFISQFKDTLYTALAEGIANRLGELLAQNKSNNPKEKWITIKGNHILLKDGESIADAFKRVTGTSLSKDNKTVKKDTHKSSKEYTEILSKVKESNNQNISAENIIKNAVKNLDLDSEKLRSKIEEAEAYNDGILQTNKKYSNGNGIYKRERAEYHKEIIKEIFKNSKNAKPEKGEKPTFIVLGGRGGSGKSKFNGLVYDKSKYIVLDADAIKELLPEYKGYNAFEVHEESSDILKRALQKAQKAGLNVVLDGTMKSFNSTEKHLKSFDDAGYNIEMYYMHLPREKAAERALGRFMGDNGRYVPLEVLLSMKDNEDNFDKLKKYASKWAFYNNDVPRKEDKPILIDKNY